MLFFGEDKSFLSQILIVFISTIACISDGMQVGFSALLLYMINFKNYSIQVTDSDIVWVESSYLIGGILVLPLGSYLTNTIGRRKTIMTANLVALIGWVIIMATPSIHFLYFARFLTGAGSDTNYIGVTTYISEISDQFKRGLFVSFVFVMLLFGTLLIYSAGPFIPMYGLGVIAISLILITIFSLPVLPESPYFLMIQNKSEEAREALVRLRRSSRVDKELDEIKSSIERQCNEKGGLYDVFRDKNSRKVLLISIILTAGMSVNSVMLMNVHGILTAAKSIYLDAYFTAIVFCVLILVSSFGGSILVDKYGRRVLLIVSTFLTGVCFLVLAVYFTIKKYYNKDELSWIPMVAVMSFAIVYKFGIGQIPFVVVVELFSTNVKATGITFAQTSYLVMGLINNQIYNHFSRMFGISVPFYIFTGLCFIVVVFTYFVVPESKGKTLKEIQHSCFNHKQKNAVI